MGRILQFPKEKAKRVLNDRKKAQGQKTLLLFSLFSFVLVAVISNEQMMKSQRPLYLISDNSPRSIETVNRAIASAQPMHLFRDVEWEHRLAKRLAGGEGRLPASAHPTLYDDFRYGILGGKYRVIPVNTVSGKVAIQEVEYIESPEINDRPVDLEETPEAFLRKYAELFPVDFEKVVRLKSQNGVETWSLISEEKAVGQAELTFDEEGRFLKMKVQKIERQASE